MALPFSVQVSYRRGSGIKAVWAVLVSFGIQMLPTPVHNIVLQAIFLSYWVLQLAWNPREFWGSTKIAPSNTVSGSVVSRYVALSKSRSLEILVTNGLLDKYLEERERSPSILSIKSKL
jgi:hypothetical protein